jgi:mono/diheme cytochrome c family protein
MTKDSDPDVAIQAFLTANLFKLPNVEALIRETMDSNKARGVQEIGQRTLQRITSAASTAAAGFSPEQQEQLKEGETIYKSLCATCHGEDARGVAVAGANDGAMMGPALAGSPRVQGHRDYVIKTLLHGMTGPLAGQSYTQVMLPMGAQNDQWIANVTSYIRNDFGNSASFISPADVVRARTATAARKTMWTYSELDATLPRILAVDPTWTATASHNADKAANGFTLAGWTTGVPQAPGMWFQVELPKAAIITEVQFESGLPGGRNAPRAAAGRGAGAGGEREAPLPFGSYPLSYQVQVSMDGRSWGAPVAEGKGSTRLTIATFSPVQAKFVRITQTGSGESPLPWSVLAFRVYQADAGR